MREQSYYFALSVRVACCLAVLFLCRLLTDVDEVARGLGLARYVCLEISIDAVLHFATKGLVQQTFEALQTMRIVGQTEFTAEDKQSMHTLQHLQPLNKCTSYCV